MERYVQTFETQHEGMIHDTSFNFQGTRTANCYGDGHIVICDLGQHSEIQRQKQLEGHQGPVWQVSWAHPKFGGLLASCGFDRKIIIWKEYHNNEWKQLKVFQYHENSVNSIQFSPEEFGLKLAAGSADGAISILYKQNEDWERTIKYEAHSMGINCIVWGSHYEDNSKLFFRVASGSLDKTVRIWSVDPQYNYLQLLFNLQAHTDWVRDVSWNFDSDIVASGGEDKTMFLWKIENHTFSQIKKEIFQGPVWRIQWSPIGNKFHQGGMLAVSSASNQSDNFLSVYQPQNGDYVLFQSIEQYQ